MHAPVSQEVSILYTVGLALLLGCAGCGKSNGPTRAAVGGRVTLDGKEIDVGTIAFYPTAGLQGPVAGGSIQNGRYSIARDRGPIVGQNRVEIHASKKTGRQVQAPMAERGVMTDESVEAVPACYNTQSKIVADVKSGSNTFDYELTAP